MSRMTSLLHVRALIYHPWLDCGLYLQAIRFYTKVEMLGTVKTGLTPRFTMELVNNMNLRRIMRYAHAAY